MFYAFEMRVKIDVVDLGADGAKDIGIGIVANHDTVCMHGAQLFHGILENPWIGFFMTCGL